MKSRKLPLLLTASLCFASLTSCKMMDNAEKAAANSGKAANNSGIAAKAASESREEIANGRIISRSGGSKESRDRVLNLMMDKRSFKKKLEYAVTFVNAFEFQLWSGQKYDSQELLEKQYSQAMSELFNSVREVNNDEDIHKTELTPFKLSKKKKRQNLDVYALAVALHKKHNFQTFVVEKKFGDNFDEVSAYDLLKNSLQRIELKEKGQLRFEELKDYELEVYDNREEAIALIQARGNMLLTMALSKVSDLDESVFDAAKVLYFDRDFSSQFTSLNLGQQYKTNVYLDAAFKVKTFLLSIDEDLKIGKKLAKAYRNMILPSSENSSLKLQSYGGKEMLDEHLETLDKIFDVNNNRLYTKRSN